MAEEEDRASKTEDPTQKKLDDARRKGDVAKSPDVPAFAALAAAGSVALLAGGSMARDLSASLLPFIAHPDAFDLRGAGGAEALRLALGAAAPAGAIMLAAAAGGVAGNVLQHGFLWTPAKLNPAGGFKRLFGLDAAVSFAKSLLKLVGIAAVVWMVMRPHAATLQELSALQPAAILPLSMDLLRAVFVAVLVVLGVTAGADWIWQRQRWMARLRMSREDMKQETKDADGDPHIKAKLRAQRMARSRQRMMQAVPKATVVIMNPTHYAVALRYLPGEDAAPLCVAKGLDSLALKIRSIAEESGVAVVEDPPLARTLYAALDIDQSIPVEHYQAVAKVIGFVLGVGRRTRPLAAGMR